MQRVEEAPSAPPRTASGLARYRDEICPAAALAILAFLPLRWCMERWLLPESPQAHQPLIFPAFLYVLWVWRPHLTQVREETADSRKGSLWLASLGCLLVLLSYPDELPNLAMLGLVVAIAGAVDCAYGRPMLRALRAPILFLCLAIPFPEQFLISATFALQIQCTGIAGALLQAIHVPVVVQGNLLAFGGHQVQISPACSGLGLILPATAATCWLLLLRETSRVQRVFLLTAAALVSYGLNILRITMMGLIAYGAPAWVDRLHGPNSWLFTLLAIGSVVLLCRLMGITRPCVRSYDSPPFSL